jgi:hypothetical protein
MGIGTSLVVFAVGAILRFAVTVTTTGFNIHTIGLILMIVGAVGFVLSLVFWGSWGGFGAYRRERSIYRDPQTGIMSSHERISTPRGPGL